VTPGELGQLTSRERKRSLRTLARTRGTSAGRQTGFIISAATMGKEGGGVPREKTQWHVRTERDAWGLLKTSTRHETSKGGGEKNGPTVTWIFGTMAGPQDVVFKTRKRLRASRRGWTTVLKKKSNCLSVGMSNDKEHKDPSPGEDAEKKR